MKPERWFSRELGLIYPDYFAFFDTELRAKTCDSLGRWVIGRWRFKPSLYRINPMFPENFSFIMGVKREDELGADIGYMPLDMRTIDTMREGFHNARLAKEVAQKIDEDNARMIEKEEAETDYILRHATKKIWHRFQEPTIFLGG